MSWRKIKNRTQAFTLVELMVVVLVLGALAFVAMPRVGQCSNTTMVTTCKANVVILNQQIELYKIQTDAWPQNYNILSKDVAYFPDGPPQCPFGNTYVINPTSHRVTSHSH